jgi:cobalt/nickel transport system permease protein/cobalt/nickel transport protein
MLISNMLGASLVEALITALGVAYIQANHPQFLTSVGNITTGGAVEEGQAQKSPLWQVFAIGTALMVITLFVVGLIAGKGNITHLFGTDWSQVSWTDVGIMLLITAVIAVILIPLAWFLLPKPIKRVGTFFVAIAIIAPLGLIAPGFAFAEGGPDDVKKAFGYIPQGLQQLSGWFSAPLDGYNVKIPFFNDPNAPLWHAAIGYEISGIVGVLLIGLIVLGIATLIRRYLPRPEASLPPAEPKGAERPA